MVDLADDDTLLQLFPTVFLCGSTRTAKLLDVPNCSNESDNVRTSLACSDESTG
jgi:hypothetical protein